MSKISIKPADTGTATFTIEAPATNTNRTLTLPDEAGSVLTSAGVPASAMPAGSVIQVVNTFKDSLFSSIISGVSASVDVPGLSASVTPTSADNKILVTFNIIASVDNVNFPGLVFAKLLRNGNVLPVHANNANKIIGPSFRDVDTGDNTLIYFSFLDSPQSTSQQTYQIQVGQNVTSGSTTVYVNGDAVGNNRGASSITAMEIAG